MSLSRVSYRKTGVAAAVAMALSGAALADDAAAAAAIATSTTATDSARKQRQVITDGRPGCVSPAALATQSWTTS